MSESLSIKQLLCGKVASHLKVACLLCHHVDFDSKHPALLFGRRPLQAEVPTCKLHGELHFDLTTDEKHS